MRLSPPQSRRYRRFSRWLEDELPAVTDKERVWEKFLEHSKNREEAERALSAEAPPSLAVMPMAGDGRFNKLARPNAIDIAKRLVKAFEADPDSERSRLKLESTILHELVHWTWRHHREPREMGDLFEREAYGPAPGGVATADAAAVPAPTTSESPTEGEDSDLELGALSRRWEARGDPGSFGIVRTGGPSYGLYQIASGRGRMREFLRFLRADHAPFAAALEAAGGDAAARRASMRFVVAWQQLAQDPAFAAAQHRYIETSHYRVFERNLAPTIVLTDREHALQEVAWSVSVQHGPGATHIFTTPWRKLPAPDREDDRVLIGAIYDYRSRVEIHFKSSTASVKRSVRQRFREERVAALALLET